MVPLPTNPFLPWPRELMRMIRDLWRYRDFISAAVSREFKSKYNTSLFGIAWTVINPLAMISVYTIIFSKIMRARLPGIDTAFSYSIFLCAGVLTWGLFTEITSRSQTMFIDNANLLKKLMFPRICLPAIVVVNALVNFSIIFSIFTGFLFLTGNFPGLAFLALIPLLALLVAFSTGMGLVLGVLNVFFRDVGQAFGIAITFWFWLTPIVYAPTILPKWTQSLMALNPLASFMKAVQGVLVNGEWPHWASLTNLSLYSIVLLFLGLRLFRKHAAEMVDEL